MSKKTSVVKTFLLFFSLKQNGIKSEFNSELYLPVRCKAVFWFWVVGYRFVHIILYSKQLIVQTRKWEFLCMKVHMNSIDHDMYSGVQPLPLTLGFCLKWCSSQASQHEVWVNRSRHSGSIVDFFILQQAKSLTGVFRKSQSILRGDWHNQEFSGQHTSKQQRKCKADLVTKNSSKFLLPKSFWFRKTQE